MEADKSLDLHGESEARNPEELMTELWSESEGPRTRETGGERGSSQQTRDPVRAVFQSRADAKGR